MEVEEAVETIAREKKIKLRANQRCVPQQESRPIARGVPVVCRISEIILELYKCVCVQMAKPGKCDVHGGQFSKLVYISGDCLNLPNPQLQAWPNLPVLVRTCLLGLCPKCAK